MSSGNGFLSLFFFSETWGWGLASPLIRTSRLGYITVGTPDSAKSTCSSCWTFIGATSGRFYLVSYVYKSCWRGNQWGGKTGVHDNAGRLILWGAIWGTDKNGLRDTDLRPASCWVRLCFVSYQPILRPETQSTCTYKAFISGGISDNPMMGDEGYMCKFFYESIVLET